MGTEVQSKAQALPPIVKLRGDLLGALERQSTRAQGIIDKRHVLIACQQIEANPALLKCSPASIFREIFKAGLYGWVCDGILGQGYLVPFAGEATLIAGYKGLRDLVRRSGQADTVMEAVREGDTFEFRGIFAEPLFIKSTASERSNKPVIGAFVIVHYFASRSVKTFWWPVAEILAHRDRYSIGWKKKGGPNNTDHLWHEKNPAFAVMAMKTVLRAVINRGEVPVSLEDRNVMRDLDEPDGAIDVQSGSVSAASGFLSEQPVVPDENAAQPDELETVKPGETTAPIDPQAAEDLQTQSDALEREYISDLLPTLKSELEIRGLRNEAAGRADLTDDAKLRITEACEKRIGGIKGSRGQKSNGGQKTLV